MKIVCIISPYYDYLTSTLMEGLINLGHQIIASENSNYAKKISDKRIVQEAEDADLILVFSNVNVRYNIIKNVNNERKIYIDGSDSYLFTAPKKIKFKAIFKRELGKFFNNKNIDRIFPLPFAAEKRYFLDYQKERNIEISFSANLNNNLIRKSIHERLISKNNERIFSGSTGERAYREKGGIGWPIKTPVYRELLASSKVAVNAAGAGYDCARYWEILASGAVLLTQDLDIQIPNPFTDMENCLVFKSLEDFEVKVDQILSNKLDLMSLSHNGKEHLHRHHTTTKRAIYFLEKANEAIQLNGYCEWDYPMFIKNNLFESCKKYIGGKINGNK